MDISCTCAVILYKYGGGFRYASPSFRCSDKNEPSLRLICNQLVTIEYLPAPQQSIPSEIFVLLCPNKAVVPNQYVTNQLNFSLLSISV